MKICKPLFLYASLFFPYYFAINYSQHDSGVQYFFRFCFCDVIAQYYTIRSASLPGVIKPFNVSSKEA